MSSVAEALRELHRLHQRLSELNDQIARGPRLIAAAEHRLQTAQQELTEAKDTHQRAKILADEKQLQLKSREDRIADLKGKLNSAASNREYQTLKDQIEADQQANAVLTDEILELLERIDALAEAVATAQQRVAESETHLAKTRDEIAARDAQLQEQKGAVESELAVVEARLPADFRADYDRIVRLRGAEGLAAVTDESCGACFQTLTHQMLNELAIGKPVFCSSCGAILFLDEAS